MANASGADDREARLIALLEDNVLTELRVMNGALDLGLSDSAMESLMQAVTSSVLDAFAVDWSPDWVRAGQVHSWENSGEHFARCAVCLLDSPPAADKATAAAWAHQHVASH
jgi:hypothetical protein